MSLFALSHHGTMFVYPLQVQLYEVLRSAVDNRLGNCNARLLDEHWLIQRLTEYGYGVKAIRSEIVRSCYAAHLFQLSVDEAVYKLTPWGIHLIDSLLAEATWQPRQAILKVARRGVDNYQLVVRDSSFLSPALREVLAQWQFKERRDLCELRRSRTTAAEMSSIVNELLTQLNADCQVSAEDEQPSGSQAVLSLIARYGKAYASIQDRYVHYAIPCHYAWQASHAVSLLCRAVLTLGRRPIEWRGQPFTEDDVSAHLDLSTAEVISTAQKRRCFQYLLAKGFLRAVRQPNLYTLTGQGAVWLETYFRVVDENFSHLDVTLRGSGHKTFWLRLANSTYFPQEIRSVLEAFGAHVTPEWFYLSQLDQAQVVQVFRAAIPGLTIWKRKTSAWNQPSG